MCGIAGYSLSASSSVERTLAAQALLAGIAERGADAVGYAYVAPTGEIEIHKQRSGASALLEQVVLPASASEVLVHVRDYTKGHPRIEANNHPIRHGAVVGVHNGIIFNDDELMASHGFERAEPRDDRRLRGDLRARGVVRRPCKARSRSSAARWRRRGSTSAARARSSSPAVSVGRSGSATGREESFFASTKQALEVVERFLRPQAAQAGGRRGHARRDRGRTRAGARALQARPQLRGELRSRPSGHRTRARSAFSGSPRSRAL